jgi:formate-dependent nitrite reductase cytochrome c552 subunit
MKRILASVYSLIILLILALAFGSNLHAEKMKPKAKGVSGAECYDCHDTIKDLHKSGKHVKVGCINCHIDLEKHLANPGADTRPPTNTSWEACGKCHKEQYKSSFEVAYHRPARDEKSQLTNRAPNPFWDKLMMGHGFTKEHALTRSHPWGIIDHLVVDRAYGGRFQPKKGWEYTSAKPDSETWEILYDKFPDVKEHKPFLPQTAAAANPTCFQCKTQDHILDWAYMGDPVNGAKWSRTSKPNELAKFLNHSLNCYTCHDPHAAKPRIVRDALIDALSKPNGDTLWHKDPKRTSFKVIDMGIRGYPRKIAILDKYDTKLQCGQCHVEYNCNPGTDTKTGQPVGFTDRRTNHFPYKDSLGLYDHYVNQVNFLDWRHPLTGGLLWKAQHPESEAYYNSKHSKANVSCNDCHSPKVKDAKTKKVYTSHFAVTPRFQLKETCLKCHPSWTEEQARYNIDSVKAYTKGRMRKAEFWISALIDKIVEAKNAKIDAAAIQEAQTQHLKAHILWEFWTAENSDGFHNPDLARESLTQSMDEAQKGIALINKVMGK